LAAGAIALSAAPAGATEVCSGGHTPPSPYCTNVPPVATTGGATHVSGTTATLNGVAGPNVSGGDPTDWFFEYGKTTGYGSRTPTQTIGFCPSGTTPPSPYCTTPATTPVSAGISKLKPCTTYHFRLVASNPDGTTKGADNTFKTKFAAPIKSVSAPASVKAGKQFKVKFALRFAAVSVTVLIETKKGKAVASNRLSPAPAGKHTVMITAPPTTGNYTLVVRAKLSCGTQTVRQPLKVH
jgi:hypothetical protein